MKSVQSIPIAKIHVVNPRLRSKKRFSGFVENISKVGLKKPITVRPRSDVPGEFDLVCGQGRMEAYLANGQTEVPALVLEISEEDGYLMSLVENIARRKPATLDLAEKIVRLEQLGHSGADIARKIGVSENYTRALFRLHSNGEERLLAAVERGDIPIAVAAEIAVVDDQDVQRCLAEAYEKGLLRGKALTKARNLVEARQVRGKKFEKGGPIPKDRKRISADSLVRVYQRETQRQASLVRKARICEQRLLFLTSSLQSLLEEPDFVNLLRTEGLDKMPEQIAGQVAKRGAA
ncbi:MAG: plasmid partitioning protein RepB C-terminal domain-containing protein [Pseudomonadota bacterium]